MSGPSSLARFLRMSRKELRETLRDRRTIITLLLMPLLLYPVLSLVMYRLVLATNSQPAEGTYRIGVRSPADAEVLIAAIESGNAALKSGIAQPIEIIRQTEKASEKDYEKQPVTPTEPSIGDLAPSSIATKEASVDDSSMPRAFSILQVEGDLQKELQDNTIDLVIRQVITNEVTENFNPRRAPNAVFDVEFRANDPLSEAALRELSKVFQAVNSYNNALLRQRLGLQRPAAIEMKASAAIENDSSMGLLGVVPLILILMTITGAVYPAIDLTAGERERGTLEALVAAPVSRFTILSSKYLAVVTVAILTAMMNLLAMTITLQVTGVGDYLLGESTLRWSTIISILPLLIIFAAFFSSILLALCSFARSFKEAQAYLIPVMLLSLGPGIISLMPAVKLTPNLAAVPLLNMILLARDTLNGSVGLLESVITIIATFVYTLTALAIASGGFGKQASVVGDDFRWSDILRRPEQFQSRPTLSQFVTFLGMFFPTYFIATNLLARSNPSDLRYSVVRNSVAAFVLFLVLPLAFSSFQKLSTRSTYRLQIGNTNLASLIATFLLSVTLWVLAFTVVFFANQIGFASLDFSQLEKARGLVERFLQLPWWLTVLTMAIVPAICEEFLFRGLALSAFQTAMRDWKAILLSAFVFGVFHVVNGSLLSLERLFPTALLGIFLGWIAIKTNSLLPGILLHAIHNGLVFSIPYFETELKQLGYDRNAETPPLAWIATAVCVVAVASLILKRSKNSSSDLDTPIIGRHDNDAVKPEDLSPS